MTLAMGEDLVRRHVVETARNPVFRRDASGKGGRVVGDEAAPVEGREVGGHGDAVEGDGLGDGRPADGTSPLCQA